MAVLICASPPLSASKPAKISVRMFCSAWVSAPLMLVNALLLDCGQTVSKSILISWWAGFATYACHAASLASSRSGHRIENAPLIQYQMFRSNMLNFQPLFSPLCLNCARQKTLKKTNHRMTHVGHACLTTGSCGGKGDTDKIRASFTVFKTVRYDPKGKRLNFRLGLFRGASISENPG
jgi:hypothetical protein